MTGVRADNLLTLQLKVCVRYKAQRQ